MKLTWWLLKMDGHTVTLFLTHLIFCQRPTKQLHTPEANKTTPHAFVVRAAHDGARVRPSCPRLAAGGGRGRGGVPITSIGMCTPGAMPIVGISHVADPSGAAGGRGNLTLAANGSAVDPLVRVIPTADSNANVAEIRIVARGTLPTRSRRATPMKNIKKSVRAALPLPLLAPAVTMMSRVRHVRRGRGAPARCWAAAMEQQLVARGWRRGGDRSRRLVRGRRSRPFLHPQLSRLI